MNSKEFQLQVALEEFKVMHSQILERSRVQQQLFLAGVTLGIGVVTAAATFITPRAFSTNDYTMLAFFLLAVPLPFYGTILAYAYSDYMISLTVGYVVNTIRPQLVKLCESDDILKNESWFSKAKFSGLSLKYTWGGFHLIILFFPLLFLASYAALLLSQQYWPGGNSLYAQLVLLALNVFYFLKSLLNMARNFLSHLRQIVPAVET